MHPSEGVAIVGMRTQPPQSPHGHALQQHTQHHDGGGEVDLTVEEARVALPVAAIFDGAARSRGAPCWDRRPREEAAGARSLPKRPRGTRRSPAHRAACGKGRVPGNASPRPPWRAHPCLHRRGRSGQNRKAQRGRAREQRFPEMHEELGQPRLGARRPENAGRRTAWIALEIIQTQPEDGDAAFVELISRTRSASSCSASALETSPSGA